jgi:hypothetical protein
VRERERVREGGRGVHKILYIKAKRDAHVTHAQRERRDE